MYKIYLLEHSGNIYRPYIGLTHLKLWERVKNHWKQARHKLVSCERLTEKDRMLIDCFLYGLKPKVKILVTGIKTQAEAEAKEEEFTDTYGLENLSNIVPGDKPTQVYETREKIRNTLKGRKYSERDKTRIYASRRGKPRSEEFKKKVSKTWKKKYADGYKRPWDEKIRTTKLLKGLRNRLLACARPLTKKEEKRRRISQRQRILREQKRNFFKKLRSLIR